MRVLEVVTFSDKELGGVVDQVPPLRLGWAIVINEELANQKQGCCGEVRALIPGLKPVAQSIGHSPVPHHGSEVALEKFGPCVVTAWFILGVVLDVGAE